MTSSTTMGEEILVDLGRLIEALGEYRSVAILTGGFVPFMYRQMPGFTVPATPSLLTTDFDWTLPSRMAVLGGSSLAERLADSRFVTIPSRGTDPPVLRYQHERFGDRDLAPIYTEFLAPLVGSETNRDGKARTVVALQPGLTAQALRYLDLLFEETLDFDASEVPELGLTTPTVIRVPHPATYVIQKLLAWPERDIRKRDKDLAYVHDVAVLTQTQWGELAEIVEGIKVRFPDRWFNRVRELVGRLFGTEGSDGPSAIVRQYKDSGIRLTSEDAIRTIVMRFSKKIGLV